MFVLWIRVRFYLVDLNDDPGSLLFSGLYLLHPFSVLISNCMIHITQITNDPLASKKSVFLVADGEIN